MWNPFGGRLKFGYENSVGGSDDLLGHVIVNIVLLVLFLPLGAAIGASHGEIAGVGAVVGTLLLFHLIRWARAYRRRKRIERILESRRDYPGSADGES